MSRSRATDLALNVLLSVSVTATLLAGGEAFCRWREEPPRLQALLQENGPGTEERLAYVRTDPDSPRVFHALADKRQGLRWAAADALAAIGLLPADDAARLRDALANPDDHVRAFAAWELGEMGAPASEEAASVAPLLVDPVAGVRSAAAAALGRLGPAAEGALPALVATRRDPSDAVRAAASVVVDRLTGR